MKAMTSADELVEHWYSLVSNDNFSTQEFYEHVERVMAVQKMPGLSVSRIDLSEGGVLADRREYLRMQRERLVFDICAAPVGINYFFSYRFYVLSATVKVWQVLTIVGGIGILTGVAARIGGIFLGPVLLIALLAFAVYLTRNAIALGMRDLDAYLIKDPLLGAIYERYLRKDSYYREDMRIAYCSIVSGIVKHEVEQIVGKKGIRLFREHTRSPLLADLYRVKESTLDVKPEAPVGPSEV